MLSFFCTTPPPGGGGSNSFLRLGIQNGGRPPEIGTSPYFPTGTKNRGIGIQGENSIKKTQKGKTPARGRCLTSKERLKRCCWSEPVDSVGANKIGSGISFGASPPPSKKNARGPNKFQINRRRTFRGQAHFRRSGVKTRCGNKARRKGASSHNLDGLPHIILVYPYPKKAQKSCLELQGQHIAER